MVRAVLSEDCRTLAKALLSWVSVTWVMEWMCPALRGHLHAHFLPGERSHGFSGTLLARNGGTPPQRAERARLPWLWLPDQAL